MAQTIKLFIDVSSGSLLTGLNNSGKISATTIPLNYGDTPTLQVYLLDKDPNASLTATFPYTVVPTSGLQLEAFIDDGLADTTNIYTNQTTFAPDASLQFWTGSLNLNTPTLKTAITGKSGLDAYIQVGYLQNGLPTSVLTDSVRIKPGIPANAPSTPPNQTAISAETVAANFWSLQPVNGRALPLATTDGGLLYVYAKRNADGTISLQADPSN